MLDQSDLSTIRETFMCPAINFLSDFQNEGLIQIYLLPAFTYRTTEISKRLFLMLKTSKVNLFNSCLTNLLRSYERTFSGIQELS